MFFGTGTTVVCLKDVGIADSVRDKLKSVKTLASWSVHACSTRPGNPSGFFSGRDWVTSQNRGKDERSKVQRDP